MFYNKTEIVIDSSMYLKNKNKTTHDNKRR
jgi:hypothetical protein